MIREYGLHPDAMKMSFVFSTEMWADEEVDSEHCSAMLSFYAPFV